MAIYQIFVKLLDGRTQCLQISSPIISGETLKRHLFAKTKIPHPFQRVITGSRIVSDETLIYSSADGFFPSCVLLLRLPGGKGGFGSLLRGAATKAGQKKTNNFDACRDMSGRRLRHVNAEKKLEEWKAEAEDRRLEKLAEQFLKKKAKNTKKNTSVDVDKYLEKYRDDSAKCMEEVEECVRQSFDVYKDLKRKIYPSSDPSSKRLKIWLGKNKVDESYCEDGDENDTDEDDDGTEDISVVLECRNFLMRNKETNKSALMVAGSGVSSDGESSGGASDQSNLEQANGHLLDAGYLGNSLEQSNFEDLNEKCEVIFPEGDQSCPNWENNFGSDDSFESESMVPESAFQNDAISNAVKEPKKVELKLELRSQIKPDVGDELDAQVSDNSSMEKLLNFDKYNSATELEMKEGMTFCNMVIKADGKNGVVPAYEFTFNFLEDKHSVEYEPVYSDKDVRFFQDYRCDVSKLEPSAAKGKKDEVPTYLFQAAHKAWMYIDNASKSQDQMERLVLRSLRKLVVILLPVLIVLLAWVVLETLRLIIGMCLHHKQEFSWQDGPQKSTTIRLT